MLISSVENQGLYTPARYNKWNVINDLYTENHYMRDEIIFIYDDFTLTQFFLLFYFLVV